MYRHILIAVDGSESSLTAAEHGLALAQALEASVSAITVTPTWSAIDLSELALGLTEEKYEERAKAYANKVLEKVLERAAAASVPCDVMQVMHAVPYKAIIEAADARACDLIVVGSHGRRGVERLLLGSEASKLVTLSKVSVLISRG